MNWALGVAFFGAMGAYLTNIGGCIHGTEPDDDQKDPPSPGPSEDRGSE